MKRRSNPVPVRIVHDEIAPSRPKDHMHMSVRQIENGFIVNRHGFKDGKHFDEERFTPHAPYEEPSRRRAPARRAEPRVTPGEPTQIIGVDPLPKRAKRTRYAMEEKAPKLALDLSDAPLPRNKPQKDPGREQRLMKIKL